MKIEILYPSCANLYGEATAVTYMRQCLPEAEFVLTELNDVPAFASEKVDMVFMGGMTEDTQELVIEHWKFSDSILKRMMAIRSLRWVCLIPMPNAI